jgi:hypothetical protein
MGTARRLALLVRLGSPKNRVGGCPLFGQPPTTPPCVPFGTRRFNGLRVVSLTTCLYPDIQAVAGNHFARTVPSVFSSSLLLGPPIGSLGFRPTPPWSVGSFRFPPSSWYATFPSTPGTSTVRPFTSRSPDCFTITVPHPYGLC